MDKFTEIPCTKCTPGVWKHALPTKFSSVVIKATGERGGGVSGGVAIRYPHSPSQSLVSYHTSRAFHGSQKS